MGLGCPQRLAPYEHHTSSTLLKSARRSAPTQWQDSTQTEYKTLYAQIVHNKSYADAIRAPNRLTTHDIASQQPRHNQRALLTASAIFLPWRAEKKMMKSRFTNGNQLCIQLAIPVA